MAAISQTMAQINQKTANNLLAFYKIKLEILSERVEFYNDKQNKVLTFCYETEPLLNENSMTEQVIYGGYVGKIPNTDELVSFLDMYSDKPLSTSLSPPYCSLFSKYILATTLSP